MKLNSKSIFVSSILLGLGAIRSLAGATLFCKALVNDASNLPHWVFAQCTSTTNSCDCTLAYTGSGYEYELQALCVSGFWRIITAHNSTVTDLGTGAPGNCYTQRVTLP